MDDRQVPSEEQIAFQKRAGMAPLELEAFRRTRPSRFSSLVSPLPNAYRRVQQDDQLKIGKRTWVVHVGNGHAPSILHCGRMMESQSWAIRYCLPFRLT